MPASSRPTAETLLLIRYVGTANGGCDSRGGIVVTELPRITWHRVDSTPRSDGTIGGVAFVAELGADGTWHVNLLAC